MICEPVTEFKYRKTHPNAFAPTKAYANDAGYDLYAREDFVLLPGHGKVVDIGISIAIPEGYYGRIASRSSVASKNGCIILGGVVDQGYSGPLKVILHSLAGLSRTGQHFKRGSKIAQLIIEKHLTGELFTEMKDDVKTNGRGNNGFGSSGL